MTLIICSVAGLIGAILFADQWPERSVKGFSNGVAGLIGGLIVYLVTKDAALIDPGLSLFLRLLMFGAAAGALASLTIGTLHRRITRT